MKLKSSSSLVALCLFCALLSCGCSSDRPSKAPASSAAAKIRFTIENIRPDGLRGPPDGLVAVPYEFCVPADPNIYREVRSLDPTVQIMPGARGRIGCSKEQSLCVGSTHQKNWRQVLLRLAALDYVTEIRECFFE